MNVKMICWVTATLLLAADQHATASSVVFSSDFESESVGQKPAGWTVTGEDGNASARVSDTNSSPGSTQSLCYEDNSITAAKPKCYMYFADVYTNTLRLRTDWIHTGQNNVLLRIEDGLGHFVGLQLTTTGVYSWNTTGQWTAPNILISIPWSVPITTGKWYRCELIYHPPQDGSNVVVSISRLSTNAWETGILVEEESFPYGYFTNLNRFLIGQNSAAAATNTIAYLDNVSLETYTAPDSGMNIYSNGFERTLLGFPPHDWPSITRNATADMIGTTNEAATGSRSLHVFDQSVAIRTKGTIQFDPQTNKILRVRWDWKYTGNNNFLVILEDPSQSQIIRLMFEPTKLYQWDITGTPPLNPPLTSSLQTNVWYRGDMTYRASIYDQTFDLTVTRLSDSSIMYSNTKLTYGLSSTVIDRIQISANSGNSVINTDYYLDNIIVDRLPPPPRGMVLQIR